MNTQKIYGSIDINRATTIVYNKILTILEPGCIYNCKIGALESTIAKYKSLEIKLYTNRLKKVEKILQALNFNYTIDLEYGFDWECKIIASK